MQFRLFIVALCFLSASLKAQPVFDVFQFRYQYSNPTKLLNKPEGQDAVLNFFQSQLNLPLKISPRDVVLLNPSYERRRINTGSNNLLSPHGPTYKELDFHSCIRKEQVSALPGNWEPITARSFSEIFGCLLWDSTGRFQTAYGVGVYFRAMQ